MSGRPVHFQWDGEAMIPLHPRIADREYVVGERYTLAPWEDRSQTSHNHQFAWIAEAWRQLPETLADIYPTPKHLRKRALIQAGYYNESVVDAGSNAAALRVAAMLRSVDEFSIAIVRGSLVVRREAKSQARGAMNKTEFEASKRAVLDVVARLIGVEPDTLQRQAGRAA